MSLGRADSGWLVSDVVAGTDAETAAGACNSLVVGAGLCYGTALLFGKRADSTGPCHVLAYVF